MTHCSSTCNAGKKNNLSCIPSLIDSQSYVLSCDCPLSLALTTRAAATLLTPSQLSQLQVTPDTRSMRVRACVCGLILHQVPPSPKSITARYIKICYCGELGTHPLCCPSRKIHSLFCNSDLTHSTCIRKAVIGSQASWSLVEASWSLSYLFWK